MDEPWSLRDTQEISGSLRGSQRTEAAHERDDDPGSGKEGKSAGVEPAGGGVPWKRDAGQSVVPGEWDQHQDVLQLAEESIRGHGGGATGWAKIRESQCPTARDQRRGHGAHRASRGGCVHGSRRGDCGGHREGTDGMLSDFNCACPVYIACGYTDLRRGIDGLAGLVKSEFDLDPFQEALFLFCGRRRDRIKALYWEGNGFVLLYKRLEQGVYQWPRTDAEVRQITPQQYRWLMEGLKVEQPKAHRPVTGLSII